MKTGAVESLKFKKLKMKLKLAHWQAVGLLEALWLFTARNAPNGDIGKHSNEDIAIHIEWSGNPDELMAELVDARWVDASDEHRLVVHDWHDHMPNWLKGTLKAKVLREESESASSPKAGSKDGSKVPSKTTPKTGSLRQSSETPAIPYHPISSPSLPKETPIPPLPKPRPEIATANGDGWDLKEKDLGDTDRLIRWIEFTKLVESDHANQRTVLAAAERALSVGKIGGEPVEDRVAYFVSIVRDKNWKVITDNDRDRATIRHIQWDRANRPTGDPLGIAEIFKSPQV